MSVVIRVENLSKQYRLGLINRRMLYQDIQAGFARLTGRQNPNISAEAAAKTAAAKEAEFLWALREVSFDVRDGDVLGIIGRNGSGKSTLLKVLSHITAPTEGRVLLKGRVASLLEVGTGFHPELTGRDNVYLNGSILGMTRAEIDRKFDEIVDFAGVEKFLDTPVKRYSSGMTVRLAFAVAAHLEPEILVIDEVLAVGDAAFQQKCLGKMSSVAREGRTILFVSHQAAAVENLCTRGIVLNSGRLVFSGTQTEAISYYSDSYSHHEGSIRDRTDRTGNGQIRIVAVEFRDAEGRSIKTARSGQALDVYLHFENYTNKPRPELIVGLNLATHFEVPVFQQTNRLTGDAFGADLPPKGAFVCRIERLPVPASTYRLGFFVTSQPRAGESLDNMLHATELAVEAGDFFGTGQLPQIQNGVSLVEAEWRLDASAEPAPAPAQPLHA